MGTCVHRGYVVQQCILMRNNNNNMLIALHYNITLSRSPSPRSAFYRFVCELFISIFFFFFARRYSPK